LFYFPSEVTIKRIIINQRTSFFHLHAYISVKYKLHSFWWIWKIHFTFIRQVASPSTASIRYNVAFL